MKIKEIAYERLFNMENFNNERIRLVADVTHEEWSKALGEIVNHVETIHEALEKLRNIRKQFYTLYNRKSHLEEQVENLRRELAEAEEKAETYKQLIEAGKTDYIEEAACSLKTRDRIKRNLEFYLKDLETVKSQLKKLKEKTGKIESLIKQGKFREALKVDENENQQ